MLRSLPCFAIFLASITGCSDPTGGGSTQTSAATTTGSTTLSSDATSSTDVGSPTTEDSGTPATSSESGVPACEGIDFMTDPEHCGSCMHSCLGGACELGTCQAVAYPFAYERLDGELINSPFTIAADEAAIYVHATAALGGADGFFRLTREGADLEFLSRAWFSDTAIYPGEDVVYAYTPACCTTGQVTVLDRATDTVSVVGTSPPQIFSTWLDGDALLYGGDGLLRYSSPTLDGPTGSAPGAQEGLYRHLTGNAQFFFAAELANEQWRVLAADRSSFEPGDPLPMTEVAMAEVGIEGMVATEDRLFFATDRLWSLDLESGETTEFLAPTGSVRTLIVHAQDLYWVQDEVEIRSVDIGGGEPQTVIDAESRILGLWVDDIGLLWTTGDNQNSDPGAIWQLAF